MIELRNVDAGYGGPTVLHDVSIDVSGGEIMAIIGGNASGKSTLLNSILGLAEVEKGAVLLHDEVVDDLPPRRRVDLGIAMSLQGGAVYSSLTVRENLLMGPRAPDDGNNSRLQRLLGELPILKKMLGRRAGTLSGGEQQLVAAGRVLVQAPQVALFDEPVSGLARSHEISLLTLIANWCQEARAAVLIAEHRLPELLKISSKIIGLRRGQVAYQATPEELDSNRLRELIQ